MAEKLTKQQQQAVYDRGGKLLVSAAAGSGKTKVLVDRLMSHLKDETDPANLDEFLIITYTKAAASELRGKIAKKLTEHIANDPENRHLQHQLQRLYLTKISTVHSFCSDILREYAYRLDLPADFRVADENECRELRSLVMQELLNDAYEAMEPDFAVFVDTQGLGRTDALVPEIIEKVYNSARCHLDSALWLQHCMDSAEVSGLTDAGDTTWGRYLMDDLFVYLDRQIDAVARCVEIAQTTEGLEKQAILLSDTLVQLKHLREAETWDQVVERKQIDFGRLIFPRKFSDIELTERIKAVRNACKDGLEKKLASFADSSEQVLLDLSRSTDAVRGMVKLVREFGKRYDEAKRRSRVLDFGDLEHRTLDLLLGKNRSSLTAAAVEIGRRFREIMVDEYQDSNAVQDAIFDALTRQRQNLFMVGDVKQSIYQFRLADPGIFLEKYEKYQNIESVQPGEGRKVLLSANFRSSGAVLSATNEVFRTCMSPAVGGLYYGDEEALQEGIPHAPLGEPEVALHAISVAEETYPEEASYVAEQVCELLNGSHFIRDGENLRPIKAQDIVILLRSPGSVGSYFQQALERRGIRCTSGGGNDLLQTQEIGVLRSLLQTISNPRQDIPLLATLLSPAFGFTADDLAHIRSKNRKGSIYDALLLDGSEKTQGFLSILSQLRLDARLNTLAQLLDQIFSLTRMDSIFAAMEGGEGKNANLQAFYQLAVDFENGSRRDLSQFLDHLTALEEKGLISAGEQLGGAVTIMSIHKSKGLEFPVVFLCGLSREFNRESARAQVLCDKELGLGLSCVDSKNRVRYPTISKRAIAVKTLADSLSEELRVLYVAMTRAKDRLVMTYASRRLDKDAAELALRMDLSHRELLTGNVSSPGEWVLMEALQHTEAGALFALGARPAETRFGQPPWQIIVAEGNVDTTSVSRPAAKEQLPDGTVERLRQSLVFRYPHEAATVTPSKQTATQIKGRDKDQESAENAQPAPVHSRRWRKPSFRGHVLDGRDFGNAIHTAMQYIRYENCGSEKKIRREVQRLVEERFLTVEQGNIVDIGKLARFFATDIGKKLCDGKNVLREFKFSIFEDASSSDDLAGEMVLLQGVIDCALMEEDGITVLDFKTDYVTDVTIAQKREQYRPQVEAYARALARIFERPIKAKFLYFFHLDRFEQL